MKAKDCDYNMELVCKTNAYKTIGKGEKITLGNYWKNEIFSQNGVIYHLDDFEPIDKNDR